MFGKIINSANIKRAYLYWKKNGFLSAWYACLERIGEKRKTVYKKSALTESKRRAQQEKVWDEPLLFSIVVPVYETKTEHFREMTASVRNQTYPHWELLIVDASLSDKRKKEVESYKDSRIHYCYLKENNGISQNTNEGLKMAKGDYIGLLDHDDVLEENALYEMMRVIEKAKKEGHRMPKLLYSDEDKGNGDFSIFYEPHYKEEFNLDLILSNNYICHFLVMEAALMKKLGFRKAYDGAQDYDLILRAVDVLFDIPEAIVHVPGVLYHWRCHAGSTAENPRSKMYAYEAGRQAVASFCESRGWAVKITHTEHLGFYRVEYVPDVFQVRKDVAAAGGRIVKHGKIVGGAYREDGTTLYEGLSTRFSGYMHKASLCQDVEALDVRSMEVRPELRKLLACVQKKEKDPKRAGIIFGRKVRKLGYRLLWDPKRKPVQD